MTRANKLLRFNRRGGNKPSSKISSTEHEHAVTANRAVVELTRRMNELTELMGQFPTETRQIDPRAWASLQVYALKSKESECITTIDEYHVAQHLALTLQGHIRSRRGGSVPEEVRELRHFEGALHIIEGLIRDYETRVVRGEL